MSQDPVAFSITHRIPFYEGDAMGVVWHGNYLHFFEMAREALMEKIGYSYTQMQQGGLAWPVVDVRVKFRHPVRPGDEIEVKARVEDYENRLKICYTIFNLSRDRVKCTEGYTVQVPVDPVKGELYLVTPKELTDAIEKFGA